MLSHANISNLPLFFSGLKKTFKLTPMFDPSKEHIWYIIFYKSHRKVNASTVAKSTKCTYVINAIYEKIKKKKQKNKNKKKTTSF